MASVFVSHSSLDGPVVEDIAGFLRDDENHRVFLDRHPTDGILGGEAWEQVLYDRLHAADAVVAVVTAHHVSSQWCFAEVALAKSLGRHVLPVRAEPGATHPLLEAVQSLDYAVDRQLAREAMRELLRSIDAGGGAAWNTARPLFPGLVAFDTSDAPVFFGRDQEIKDLTAAVRSLTTQRLPRALMVIGASGSGKSSLVRAGLLPRLVVDGWWPLPPVLPGADPILALAVAFGQGRKELEPDTRLDLATLTERVSRDFDSLTSELLLAAPGRRDGLVIVVDQFEELFTRAPDAATKAFLELLSGAAEPGRRTAVIGTMRSEFQSDLLACEAAGALRTKPFTLPPLGRAQLASVITGPARKGRRIFDDQLVARLVEDAGGGDALPLLAYVLQQLTEATATGDTIHMADYDRIGGVHGALRAQADQALEWATARTSLDAAGVLDGLLRLVSVDASGRPTRSRVGRSQLSEAVLAAVHEFVNARLITTDEISGEPTLAFSHEAIFTAWPRLQGAIREQIDRLQLRRRLEQAADDWERADRDRSMLWRGDQLARARAAMTGSTTYGEREQQFVAAAVADVESSHRRDADILADRIRAADLVDYDSELALLLLLVAVDEQAPTDGVIGGLRQALARHRLIARIEPPDARVTALAMSADGGLVAIADEGSNEPTQPTMVPMPLPPPAECRVTVWRSSPAELLQTIWIPGRRISAMAVCPQPSGWRVVTAIDRRPAGDRWPGRRAAAVEEWLAVTDATPSTIAEERILSEEPTSAVAIAEDGDRVVVTTPRGERRSFTVITSGAGQLRVTATDPGDATRLARVGSDNDTSEATDDGGWPEAFAREGWAGLPPHSMSTYTVPGRRAISIDAHGLGVRQVDPVDKPLAVAHVDGQVALLRWRNARRIAVMSDGRLVDLTTGATAPSIGTVCAMSADGAWQLVSDPVRLYNVTRRTTQPIAVRSVRAAAFSEDGTRLAVAEWGALSVHDVATGAEVARLGVHEDEEGDLYTGVALTRDGSRLVSASLGGTRAHLWDIDTGRPLSAMPWSLVDLSPDGADVVTRELRQIVADLSTGVELRIGPHQDDATVMLAPDRRSIVVVRRSPAGPPGALRSEEYNVPEGHPLFADPEPCTAVTLSSDSNHLLVARPDGTVVQTMARRADEVIARARRFVFRAASSTERGSFSLDH